MKTITLTLVLSFLYSIASPQQNQLVKNLSKGDFPQGLSGRHIALWHSHGFYYDQSIDRWKWQRARCFSNAEDIGNMPYVVSYLTPMLENAGAVVVNPRERDTQRKRFIIDADGSSSTDSRNIFKGRWIKELNGFKYSDALYNTQNPFKEGTHFSTHTNNKETATATYLPNMETNDKGYYAVYVSWVNTPNNVSDVTYRVYHTGGVSEFQVNQKMFGETWTYLGTFYFDENHAKVVVSNKSNEDGIITTDAVRFGGGMGIVARRPTANANGKAKSQQNNSDDYTWKQSGVPAYLEGARYYMQFSGIPDTIFTRSKMLNDYIDDYQGRPRWINFLKKEGIPIDLSLAFHTDAGITPNDSIIGTLAIYSTLGDTFTDGRSKLLNGLFSGMVQDQIVNDITLSYNSKWTKRELRDAAYSEAAATDVPSLLLELLSHQNLADMTYSKDPRFRFMAARSIYKAMTRFLNGPNAIIQPLPPHSFAIEQRDGLNIQLKWKETKDGLEPTALAKSYRIYMKTNDNEYDPNFIEVRGSNTMEIELPEWGNRYAFKVTAVNEGGESFPTEELSVCLFETSTKPVLLVNGFTRVSAPSHFDIGIMAGFNWWEDEGVPDGYDMSFLGYQQDFDRSHPWLDDDNSGWGTCGVEGWGKLIRGNTHDFTSMQGRTYQNLGISYISTSRKAFEEMPYFAAYRFIDLMFGKQRFMKNFREDPDDFSVYTPELVAKLDTALKMKTPILISGAYIGTDMAVKNDSASKKFAETKLGYTWRTNHASKAGEVFTTDKGAKYLHGTWFFSNTFDNVDSVGMPQIKVEAPDGIEPSKDAICILRYSDNNVSAGTLLNRNGNKVVAVGFPLESMLNEEQKEVFLKQLVDFFGSK